MIPWDWKAFGAAFAALLTAEMGDKTQLAVLALSASSGKPWPVFLGGMLGLAFATALGAAAGHLLGAVVPERALRKAVSLLFVAVGAVLWWKA